MTLQRHESACVEAIGAIATASGLSWTVVTGRKHRAVKITDKSGGEHKLPIPSSPGADDNTVVTMVSGQARRLIRRLRDVG